ncbi:MAG: hypothetical protein U9N72_09335 [Bacteroidota bacterium]|nr:hypothetical protein [Bacteroidota bacterium]
MPIFNPGQQSIAEKIEKGSNISHWKDWQWQLKHSIKSIDHVEIVQLGTRMPVVLPYRITDNLIKVLRKHQPLWINTGR